MKQITNAGIFTILLVSSLTIMVGTVIAPSLSGITKELQLGFPPSWLITLPSLGVVLFAPIVGKLLKRISSFQMLCAGLVPYAILGASGGYIENDYLLMLNRFLLGASTVAIQVSITSFIANGFEGEQRMKLIAWQGMAIELGGVIFLSLGGMLGEWHWRSPFAIYLIAIVCLALVPFFLPHNQHNNQSSKQETGLSSNSNKRLIQLIFFSSLLAMLLFFVSFTTLPIYLPNTFHLSESVIGYVMAFISFMAIVTASQMPRVAKRIGNGKTIAIGFLCFMIGYILLALFASSLSLAIAAVSIGTGFGFTIPLLNHAMIEASTEQTLGRNLGLYSMGVFGGQFLSTFLNVFSHSYQTLYGIAALLALFISGVLYLSFQRIEASEKLSYI